MVNASDSGELKSVRCCYPDNFGGIDILPTLPHWEREWLQENAEWYALEAALHRESA